MSGISSSDLSGYAGILGGITKAVGSISAGEDRAADAAQRQKMALYQQQVALNNQIIAGQNAVYEEHVGISQTEIQQMRNRAKASLLKTSQAASGVDVNTGSAARVQESQAALGNTDVQNVMHKALMRAYGYRAAATGYGAQAGLYGAQAAYAPEEEAAARRTGILGASGDLLSSFKYLPKGDGKSDSSAADKIRTADDRDLVGYGPGTPA